MISDRDGLYETNETAGLYPQTDSETKKERRKRWAVQSKRRVSYAVFKLFRRLFKALVFLYRIPRDIFFRQIAYAWREATFEYPADRELGGSVYPAARELGTDFSYVREISSALNRIDSRLCDLPWDFARWVPRYLPAVLTVRIADDRELRHDDEDESPKPEIIVVETPSEDEVIHEER